MWHTKTIRLNFLKQTRKIPYSKSTSREQSSKAKFQISKPMDNTMTTVSRTAILNSERKASNLLNSQKIVGNVVSSAKEVSNRTIKAIRPDNDHSGLYHNKVF